MKAQQALIQSLPEQSQSRKNIEVALELTSEQYLNGIKEGRARSRARIRDWLEVLAWILFGVAGYLLIEETPAFDGLNTVGGFFIAGLNVIGFALIVGGSVGWGNSMRKVIFG
jgi:hypothetical protein